jgi:hypothetical protein
MSNAGTFELLAFEIATGLARVGRALSKRQIRSSLAEFGVAFPQALFQDPAFDAARQAAQDAFVELGPALQDLTVAIEGGNEVAIVAAGLNLGGKITDAIQALPAFATALAARAAGLPGITAQQIAEVTQDLPRKLVDFALVRGIDTIAEIGAAATALGIVERRYGDGDPADPTKPSFEVSRLHLERLTSLVSQPAEYLKGLYDIGAPGFDGSKLFPVIEAVVATLGLPARMVRDGVGNPIRVEAYAVDVTVAPGDPPGLDLAFALPVSANGLTQSATLPAGFAATVTADLGFAAGTTATWRPPLDIALKPSAVTNFSGRVEATLKGSPAEPYVLLGQPAKSRIEIGEVSFSAAAAFAWDAGRNAAVTRPSASGRLARGKVLIDTSTADGFIATLTSGIRAESNFELGFDVDPVAGLRFRGSSTLEIALPVHANLGPIEIPTVYLLAGFEDGRVPIEVSIDFGAKLGPIQASVSRIGLNVTLSFPPAGGNLGPVDAAFSFKPPTGIGLLLDGGGLKGGGFLSLDIPKGEYAGAVELTFQGFLQLKAVGILNTKMPDGRPGFSLLLIITAEFAPIQLGFGFTLLGVGGLVGVNRTMLLPELANGVRDGSLQSILFPRDVVANAPRIIADLKRVFPPLDGRFLIGPMAKLGWGTPTIVSLELGILLEIPRPAFAIVGILRIALPIEEAALMKFQVSFVGAVDFEAKKLTFDASLFGSYILFMPLTGDMVVRVFWGENANFLLSVGGFHPAFSPPPLDLPARIARLGIVVWQGNPSLRVECYFAVTSNTVQFGGRIELRFRAGPFGLDGHLAMDVLIVIDPFRFVAQIEAMLAITFDGDPILTVRLSLMLAGPAPWHAKGSASFEISFIFTISVSIGFEVSIGEANTTSLPPIAALAEIVAALDKPEAWRALPPESASNQVSLRELPTSAATLVLQPESLLSVVQTVAPLTLSLQRIGARKVSGGNVVRIETFWIGTQAVPIIDERREFAPAQFFDQSDADKLSGRSFKDLPAGARSRASDTPTTSTVRSVAVEYELTYVKRPTFRFLLVYAKALFDVLILTGAAAKSGLAATPRKASGLGTPKVSVGAGAKFAVVGADDLKLHADGLVFASEFEAAAALSQAVIRDPALSARLQVVPEFEMAA